MPSPFFQSYIAVLRRLGEVEAELGPQRMPPTDPFALFAKLPEPAQHEAAKPTAAAPQPGDEPPRAFAELPLGQRFRGN